MASAEELRKLVLEAKRRNDWGVDDAVRLAARLFERWSDRIPQPEGEIGDVAALEVWDAIVHRVAHDATRAASIFHGWAEQMERNLKPAPHPETIPDQHIGLTAATVAMTTGTQETDG